MNADEAIEQHVQALKALGFSDEAIVAYLKQIRDAANYFADHAPQINLSHSEQKENDEFVVRNNPTSSLTHAQRWAVACGVDIAFANGEYINDLSTGLDRADCRGMFLTSGILIVRRKQSKRLIGYLWKGTVFNLTLYGKP